MTTISAGYVYLETKTSLSKEEALLYRFKVCNYQEVNCFLPSLTKLTSEKFALYSEKKRKKKKKEKKREDVYKHCKLSIFGSKLLY